MDDVLLHRRAPVAAEVAADRARGSALRRVGGAGQRAERPSTHVVALDDQRRRPGREHMNSHERLVERLALVLGVVLGRRARGSAVRSSTAGQRVGPWPRSVGITSPTQAPADTVGLDQDEGALHGAHPIEPPRGAHHWAAQSGLGAPQSARSAPYVVGDGQVVGQLVGRLHGRGAQPERDDARPRRRPSTSSGLVLRGHPERTFTDASASGRARTTVAAASSLRVCGPQGGRPARDRRGRRSGRSARSRSAVVLHAAARRAEDDGRAVVQRVAEAGLGRGPPRRSRVNGRAQRSGRAPPISQGAATDPCR